MDSLFWTKKAGESGGVCGVKLTSDYRRVQALFNTPLEQDVEYSEYSDNIRTHFKVGPFLYIIAFYDEGRGKPVNVEFELADIHASDEELIEMMSKFKKSLARDEGEGSPEEEQPMSLEEARDLERRVLNQHGHAELEITGPYALRIFGAVINIIRDYVKRYRKNCIVFSADSEDRARLYQKMMKSAFPGAGIRPRPSPYGVGTEIRVCFI